MSPYTLSLVSSRNLRGWVLFGPTPSINCNFLLSLLQPLSLQWSIKPVFCCLSPLLLIHEGGGLMGNVFLIPVLFVFSFATVVCLNTCLQIMQSKCQSARKGLESWCDAVLSLLKNREYPSPRQFMCNSCGLCGHRNMGGCLSVAYQQNNSGGCRKQKEG